MILLCAANWVSGQTGMDKIKKKDLLILSDTTKIDTLSLNPDYFHAYLEDGTEIDPQNYEVIFSKGLFIRKGSFIQNGRKIGVLYMALPNFMTRSYSAFDPALIVPKATGEGMVFSSSSERCFSSFEPINFDMPFVMSSKKRTRGISA